MCSFASGQKLDRGDADFVIMRLNAPLEAGQGPLESLMHQGKLDFAVAIGGAENTPGLWVSSAPAVERPETLHFSLRVTDKGSPPLSRYRRVVATVTP